jgi:H+/Cl- antiporter ClcA
MSEGAARIIFPWLAYIGVAAVLGGTAGAMTVYYGPGANGSGVAEMIGYMNGVNYPEFIGINTLITKILGVVLAVSSRLCIGKEGPLGHIGSIWGILPIYIPWKSLGFETL